LEKMEYGDTLSDLQSDGSIAPGNAQARSQDRAEGRERRMDKYHNMITRNELANQINYTGNICRTLAFDWKQDFKEGDIWDNKGRAESWQCEDSAQSFIPENNNKVRYVLYCENVPCHKVDYRNKNEVEFLEAVEGEGEVLVPAETKMRIVDISTDDDYKEMGYYEVHLELI